MYIPLAASGRELLGDRGLKKCTPFSTVLGAILAREEGKGALQWRPILARDKYLEAQYLFDQIAKHLDAGQAVKYNLSAFVQAFRSVTFFLQAEFKNDPQFAQWYARKQAHMMNDPVFRILNEQRRLTVHVRNLRVIGKFTVDVRDSMMTMSDAVHALTCAPNGSDVSVMEPRELPSEFVEGGSAARVEKQFFFEGCEDKDLLALCLDGLYKLDDCLHDWEEMLRLRVSGP